MECIKMENRRKSSNSQEDQEIKSEWLQVWDRLDIYGDGRIRLGQMERILLTTKYADALHPEAFTTLLLKADLNKDGFISKDEFLLMVKESRRQPALRSTFRDLALLSVPRSGRDAKVRKYIDEYSCKPPPIFILSITIAEIVMFIYYGIALGEPITANGPAPFDSPLIYNPKRRYEAWRFLSYMFVHVGWLHILTNTIMQLVLGVILELVHKWWRVMIVYVLGVIGGCLASSVATPNYYLAGASGGVYALEYAYIGNLIMNWSEMSFPIVQAVGLAIISLMDVSVAVWQTYRDPETEVQTSYVAHLGGAIVGMLVGVNVLRNLKKEPWEKYCWWGCLVLLVLLMGSAVVVHIAVPEYFPPQDHSPL